MIKIDNVQIAGWAPSIRGMRNPKNSWSKSDSFPCDDKFIVGNNDLGLMKSLSAGGPVHA